MDLSASLIPYVVYAILGVFTLFSLFNVFHLLRFGLVGPGSLIAIGLYLAVSVLLVSQVFALIHGRDWSEALQLPFSFNH